MLKTDRIEIKIKANIKDQIPLRQLKMIEIINKFSGKLSLKDMAKKSGVSYKTFRVFFKNCLSNKTYIFKQKESRKYSRKISNEQIREQIIRFN
ncbi:hypothetical protein, partial [Mycoplasma sp. VS30B]